MKVTDYLAIWGAVVATLVAAWNIYKDFLKRHRVKVWAGFQVYLAGDGSPQEEGFAVTVTNLSDRPTTITHIGGYYDRRYKPRWLDRMIGRFVKRSTKAYFFSFNPYRSPSLPYKLEPWSKVIFFYKLPAAEFPSIETLEVTTADDQTWFCPRRDIDRIQADEGYQRARHLEKMKPGRSRSSALALSVIGSTPMSKLYAGFLVIASMLVLSVGGLLGLVVITHLINILL